MSDHLSHPASADARPLRCVSIDVEEYYHIEAAFGTISRAQWHDWPSRVSQQVEGLLGMYSRQNQRGTFFVLGDVARRTPQVVRAIAAAGHEIASHGTHHDRLHRLTPETFREDVRTSQAMLEDLTGQRVLGYRSPSFSLTRDTRWAVDVLLELGFQYDASVFPVRRRGYGVPEAPIGPFLLQGTRNGGSILELPALVWRVGSRNLPVAGGGYFRLLPLWLMRQGLRQAQAHRRPAVLYFHPWEFDPDQPRMPLSLKNRIRTYTGQSRATSRLEAIMHEPARWLPLAAALDELRQQAQQTGTFCLEDGSHQPGPAA